MKIVDFWNTKKHLFVINSYRFNDRLHRSKTYCLVFASFCRQDKKTVGEQQRGRNSNGVIYEVTVEVKRTGTKASGDAYGALVLSDKRTTGASFLVS